MSDISFNTHASAAGSSEELQKDLSAAVVREGPGAEIHRVTAIRDAIIRYCFSTAIGACLFSRVSNNQAERLGNFLQVRDPRAYVAMMQEGKTRMHCRVKYAIHILDLKEKIEARPSPVIPLPASSAEGSGPSNKPRLSDQIPVGGLPLAT